MTQIVKLARMKMSPRYRQRPSNEKNSTRQQVIGGVRDKEKQLRFARDYRSAGSQSADAPMTIRNGVRGVQRRRLLCELERGSQETEVLEGGRGEKERYDGSKDFALALRYLCLAAPRYPGCTKQKRSIPSASSSALDSTSGTTGSPMAHHPQSRLLFADSSNHPASGVCLTWPFPPRCHRRSTVTNTYQKPPPLLSLTFSLPTMNRWDLHPSKEDGAEEMLKKLPFVRPRAQLEENPKLLQRPIDLERRLGHLQLKREEVA